MTTETAETVRRLTEGGSETAEPRIEMVPNAVSLGPVTSAAADSKHIVMAGVLGQRKGVDVLLEAWKFLTDDNDGWTLQLVGPRSDDIREWPKLSGVEYIGPEDHGDLLSRLENAEIAVLVARDEALPMFILEAMAHGCCVVSTPVGQIPDVVSESTGALVPVGDAHATAKALRQLIENPHERRQKSVNARLLIESKYSEQSAKPVLENAWWKLADEGRVRDAS
ncbi:glycosyltransferase family 4 protein [Rhodococcus sp. NPDC047139]|uniref:glycosyltransferase family 4 protein n=1 Tax=Rhodococcus sp. NPDC047139 TaxID=3155141 RepID=UPI0033E754A1